MIPRSLGIVLHPLLIRFESLAHRKCWRLHNGSDDKITTIRGQQKHLRTEAMVASLKIAACVAMPVTPHKVRDWLRFARTCRCGVMRCMTRGVCWHTHAENIQCMNFVSTNQRSIWAINKGWWGSEICQFERSWLRHIEQLDNEVCDTRQSSAELGRISA